MRFNAEKYFAAGGPANVSPAQREAGNYPKKHERVAGMPISIENPQGSTRVRQDSGPAKMAADYGYIVGSAKDKDRMDVDTYVGPYKNSDKVFVINQQHPHSKKFNEHKVMLGYKDRAHAVHDYVHSFADGLGHKRVQSIVEMGTHELKDWMKSGRHNAPIKKADGGEIAATPVPYSGGEYPGEVETPAWYDKATQAIGRVIAEPFTEHPRDRLKARIDEGTMAQLEQAGVELPKGAVDIVNTDQGPVPIDAEGNPLKWERMSPIKYAVNQLGNVVGGVAAPVKGAGMLLGAGPIIRGTEAERAAIAAEKATVRAVERKLSPLGFYSHGAETAAGLPQAKGAPDQMAAMLQKYGVKPDEMYATGFANESATAAARSKIEAEFAPKVAEAQRAMEGLEPGTPEFKAAERQFKNISSTMRSDMDRALVLGDEWSSRPSVTREELAAHFNERRPQVEETVLGGDVKAIQSRIDALDNVRQDRRWTDAEEGEYRRLVGMLNDDNAPTTKFQQYTLPGGENYREVLLRLPDESGALRKETAEAKSLRTQAVADYANAVPGSPEAVEAQDRIKKYTKIHTDLINKSTNLPPEFRSGHWDDPNVLAHLRMADRTGPNGEKILHVEEIQSDWAQKGREEGFKIPLTPELENSANAIIENKLQPGAEFMNPSWRTKEGKVDPRAVTPSYVEFLEKNGTISPDEAKTLQSWNKARGFDASGVPTAPYVTNTQAWTDLALKRALREAAEGGYDKLVWTPGAEQAKRYSLSTHVDRIAYDPELKELSYVQKGVNGWQTHPENLEPNGLAAVIGKEAADKLLAQKVAPLSGNHVLEAPDLVFGGEGMKGYYDKIVPNQLSKLVKKLDPEAKVGVHDLITKEGGKVADEAALNENSQLIEQGRFWDDARGENVRGYRVTSPGGQELGVFEDLPDAHNALLQVLGSAKEPDTILKVPSLTITPKMREAIMKGQTDFARGGAVKGHPSAHIALVSDIRKTAKENGMHRPAMAHLINMMGIDKPRAAVYAQNILSDPQLHNKIDPVTEKFLITLNGAMKHTAAEKHKGELRRHLRDRVIYGNP